MCSTGPTTSYGYELSPGDETDLDDTPRCCGESMTAKAPDEDGDREYLCGQCGTALEINENGLVWDIREKAAA
jgi:hypothetical protein